MPTRTSRTAWNGTLQQGSGQVELTSSKIGTYDVDFPKRTADDGSGQTSPEELIAAAHSACFAMSLANEFGEAGGTPHDIEVTAQVDLGPDSQNGGFGLSVRLTGSAEVEGLDEAAFQQAVKAAEANCPVSKALRAVSVTADISRA